MPYHYLNANFGNIVISLKNTLFIRNKCHYEYSIHFMNELYALFHEFVLIFI